MTMLAPMIGELQQEAAITRRVLERIPEDKLTWKPHPRSMSLGQLALHTASIPGVFVRLGQLDEFDASKANFDPPAPATTAEILTAHDSGVQAAQEYLGGMSDGTAVGTWRFTAQGREVFAMARVAMLRALMFNHLYHHRGQLSVYLRLLEVPVPVIYGRSADENPLA